MIEEKGQSLVEMLLAISVIIIVILALIGITTASVRNASFARNQALATKYAEEGVEKVRVYRDSSTWATFVANCETGASLAALPSPFSRIVDCYALDLTNCSQDKDTCEVRVTVSWADSSGDHQSELKTQFTSWR